jgi:transcriptional regulator with XRE-family HTH domain
MKAMKNDFRVAGGPIPNILLRSARKQNGWTQQDVAEKIQVGVASVGRWERGEVVPNGFDCDLLCGLFRRSAEELGFPGWQEIPISALPLPEPGQAEEEVRTSNRRPFHMQLKYERQLRGWSQGDVAERIGSDTKTVSRWERGGGFPSSYLRQSLLEIFGKNAEELGLLETARPQVTRGYRTRRTLRVDLPVHCGDCERPEIAGILEAMVIDPSGDCTTFYFRFNNRTAEDAGLKCESFSLTDPDGNFSLGRSVGSFLLAAGQSIPLSVVFDWIPQRKLVYTLTIVLTRPDRWRNTYLPILLTF